MKMIRVGSGTSKTSARSASDKSPSSLNKDSTADQVLCGVCRSRGENSDGVSYCMRCKSYLCPPCTKRHNEECKDTSPSPKQETFLRQESNRSEKMSRSGYSSPPRFSARRGILRTGNSARPLGTFTTRCAKHPGNELDNYCQEHEVVVCTECMDIHHKECFVISVEEAARGACEGPRIKLLVNEFKRLQVSSQARIRQHRAIIRRMKEDIEKKSKPGTRENSLEQKNEEIIKLVEEMVAMDKSLSVCQEIDTCISLAFKALENAILGGDDIACFVTFHCNRHYAQSYKAKLDQYCVVDTSMENNASDKSISITKSGNKVVEIEKAKVKNTLTEIKSGSVQIEPNTSIPKQTSNEVILNNDTEHPVQMGRSVMIRVSSGNRPKQENANKTRTSSARVETRSSSSSRVRLTAPRSSRLRMASPTTRIVSGRSVNNAATKRSQGTITCHFDDFQRLFREADNNKEDTVQEVHVQVDKVENDATPQSGRSRAKGSARKRCKEVMTDKKASPIDVEHAGSPITMESSDLADAELNSAYGVDEINPLFDDSQSVSDSDETNYDDQDDSPWTNLKVSDLSFHETKYHRIRTPAETLLAGKRLSRNERSITRQTKPYVIRPETRLAIYLQINIKTPDDHEKAVISAVDCMPDGRVVVCDSANKSVKLFEPGGNHYDHINLKYAPFAITALSNTMVAVLSGLAYEELIILSIGFRMAMRRIFNTRLLCRDVSSFESNIYLLCMQNYETEVLVLKTDGCVTTRIATGTFFPRSIAVNSGSGIIYVTDDRDGVSAIDVTGTRFVHCKDRGTEHYHGVACDLNSHVFVTTENPTGVHEMTRDGHYIVPLLLWKGHNYVGAVCYNSARNDLVMGFKNGGVVTVAKIVDSCLLRHF